jgi:hypothetical protein
MQNGEQRIKAQVDAEMKFQTDSNLLNGCIIYSGELTQEQINQLKANPVGAEVRQGDSQPVFACAIDRDLFIKNAGTWMDVDTFCETVNERDEMRICKNCKYWDSVMKDCEEEDLFGCIELAQSPYSDGTFGCRKFISKQTA